MLWLSRLNCLVATGMCCSVLVYYVIGNLVDYFWLNYMITFLVIFVLVLVCFVKLLQIFKN